MTWHEKRELIKRCKEAQKKCRREKDYVKADDLARTIKVLKTKLI